MALNQSVLLAIMEALRVADLDCRVHMWRHDRATSYKRVLIMPGLAGDGRGTAGSIWTGSMSRWRSS
jgi:hypothetical protein